MLNYFVHRSRFFASSVEIKMQAQAFLSLPGFRSSDFYYGCQTQWFYHISAEYDIGLYANILPQLIINNLSPLLMAVTGTSGALEAAPIVTVYYQWDLTVTPWSATAGTWTYGSADTLPLYCAVKIEK